MKHFSRELWFVNLLQAYLPIVITIFLKIRREKIRISSRFVPSTIRGFYFWLTEACTCTTMTTIQITSWETLQATKIIIDGQCINMNWTRKRRIFTILVINELTLIRWRQSLCLYFDLTPQLKLMTLMHFLTWILSKQWGTNAFEITKIIV